MGLFNPILGNIPQPQKDKQEVYNPVIPQSNYKAQVVTPLINEIFVSTLETTGTQTDTETTTREVILTTIYLQGVHIALAGDTSENATVDIYINSIKVFSINLYLNGDIEKHKEFNYIIPFENVRINSNSLLKLETWHQSGYLMPVNCSFVGYISNKQ